MPEPFGEPFVEIEDGFMTPTAWMQEAQQEELLRAQVLKGVAVKDSDATRKGKFSRVLSLDQETGKIIFPEEADPPKSGSPSSILRSKPMQFKEASRATFRIDSFESGSCFSGTGFSLSPSYGLTCYHVCNGKGSYRGMNGGQVPNAVFLFAEKPRYHFEYVTGSPDSDVGVDGALFKLSNSASPFPTPEDPKLKLKFFYFLLPCSPIYTGGIGIVSYPAVTGFLLQAHKELIDGVLESGASILDAYKESMREELEDTRLQLAHKRLNVSMAEAAVKKMLFRKLLLTFCSHVTGNQTVSLGTWKPAQQETIARTTCSTLFGSSGGPVCCFDTSGYFSAWHRGAAEDYLANEACTCDDPWFVSAYFQYVLADLPAPTDAIWQNWDMEPFFQWIQKHKTGQQVSGRAYAWTQADWFKSTKRRKPDC